MSNHPQVSLDGCRVAVIGGTSGIGYAVADAVRSLGAELLVTGRDPEKLAAAGARLGGAETTQLDAHDGDLVEAFFAAAGKLDHVVSLVGDSMAGSFLATPPSTMRHVIESKLLANWTIARHATPLLRDGGSLTFTSGTGGRPHEISATYIANAGIAAMVEGLAYELAPRIRANAVAPTFMGTATEFWRDVPTSELTSLEEGFAARAPLRRLATVPEVASAYVHLIVNRYVTGHVLAVDGGIMLAV